MHRGIAFLATWLGHGLQLGTAQNIAIVSPHILSHYLVYMAMFLFLVVGSYFFHLPFEANTGRVRQWLKAQLFTRVGPVRT